MFKKKRAAPSASPATRAAAPASSAASSAAVQAFLANRSTTSLSSAAAATALRSHNTSPVPVGDIQTKRMRKRASSQSSNGSTGRRSASLSRQSSSASMADRTFRDPSPGRPSPQARAGDPPPLPPIPATLSPAPKPKAKKKAAAKESAVPARVSPEQERRGSVDKDGKRSSVNFSRPMSPPLSPPASPTSPTRSRADSLPKAEQEAIRHAINDAATAPVKKKKKKVLPQLAEGSHLVAGTVGGKPTGTAVEEQPKKKKKIKAPAVEDAATAPLNTRSPSDSSTPSLASSDTQPAPISRSFAKQTPAIREDAEGEEREEIDANGHASHSADRTATLAPFDTLTPVRRNSQSPSRSARFSEQPITPANGRLHEPLGRSISPAKSAMKQTPSPRGTSPSDPHWNRPGFTPSEASDAPSQGSEDARKKKKAVRVSFDDEPVVVGAAAELPNSSPVVASPQNDRQRKSWFSFGKDRPRPSAIEEEEDDIMKPRPALPSFGSIRGRQDSKTDSADEVYHAISSDHPISGILRRPRDHDEPVPPEVTSVEGSGYHSDSEESVDESVPESEPHIAVATGGAEEVPSIAVPVIETRAEPEPAPGPKVEPAMQAPEADATEAKVVKIPEIAIQPSTPGIETETQRDSYIHVPGGFPSSESLRGTESRSSPDESAENLASAGEPTKDPGPDTSEVLPGDESDDSGNSVYSDAASEASDFDGDGFGSINAILESPSATKESPVVARAHTPPVDHDEARESVSPASSHILQEQLRAAQGVVESTESTPTKPPKTAQADSARKDKTTPPKPSGPKKVTAATAPKETKAQPAPKETKVQPAPKETRTQPAPKKTLKKGPKAPAEPEAKLPKPALKSSMRQASSSPSPHRFRSSMRDSAIQPRMNSQTRQPKVPLKTRSDDMPLDARSLTLSKTRPMSVASDSSPLVNGGPRPKLANRPVSMSGLPAPTSSAPPVPKLPAADDSDSDSSFKRMRPRRNTGDGRVSMRRSMRAGPMQANSRANTMRSTMRPQSPEQRPQTPQRNFFGLPKKDKDASSMTASPPRPRHAARVSSMSDSDSDDGGAFRFKSRFVDSSDEEEEEELAPGRRTRHGDAESALSEGAGARRADTGRARLALVIPNGSATAAAGGQGAALAGRTLRDPDPGRSVLSLPGSPTQAPQEKRRSFFGSLGRRKDKGAKVGKADVESAARRDTPLERSRVDRLAAAMEPPPADSAEPPSPRSPRRVLQRRTTPPAPASNSRGLLAGEKWPLPPPIPEEEPADRPVLSRPVTSDGTAPTPPMGGARRPSLGARVLSGSAVPTQAEALGKGKKKRFASLRRVFGSKD